MKIEDNTINNANVEKTRKAKAHLINAYWKFLRCTPETYESTYRLWQLARNGIMSVDEIITIELKTEERLSKYLKKYIKN